MQLYLFREIFPELVSMDPEYYRTPTGSGKALKA